MRQAVIAALLVVVVACGEDDAPDVTGTVPGVADQSDDASEPSVPPLTATPVTPSPSPSASSPSPSPGTMSPEAAASPAIQAAVADLAGREGVDPASVQVVDVREVTWSDGSLGCPQPGVNYTQALVNGQLVVLDVGGRRFEYHSGGGRPLFYCADPRPPIEGSGSGAGDN